MKLKQTITRRFVMTMVIAAIVCISSQTGYAAAGPVISVEPTYTGVSHGETFTVDVMIDPCGDEVMGAQYELYFNNSLLRALSQNKGSFLSQDGASVTVYTKEINNALSRIEYSAARTGVGYGVNTPGTLTTIMFEVIGDPGISELRLGTVKLSHPNATYLTGVTIANGRVGTDKPSIPFVISGYVSHRDESICNNPAVNITNLNTCRKWTAVAAEGSNYYQIVLASPGDVIVGETLRFNVTSPDKNQRNVTEHTVTQDEVSVSGFEHNITLEHRPGDLNGDGVLTPVDAAIALQMAVCGEYDLVADVNDDKSVTSLDALMIMQAAAKNIDVP